MHLMMLSLCMLSSVGLCVYLVYFCRCEWVGLGVGDGDNDFNEL